MRDLHTEATLLCSKVLAPGHTLGLELVAQLLFTPYSKQATK